MFDVRIVIAVILLVFCVVAVLKMIKGTLTWVLTSIALLIAILCFYDYFNPDSSVFSKVEVLYQKYSSAVRGSDSVFIDKSDIRYNDDTGSLEVKIGNTWYTKDDLKTKLSSDGSSIRFSIGGTNIVFDGESVDSLMSYMSNLELK